MGLVGRVSNRRAMVAGGVALSLAMSLGHATSGSAQQPPVKAGATYTQSKNGINIPTILVRATGDGRRFDRFGRIEIGDIRCSRGRVTNYVYNPRNVPIPPSGDLRPTTITPAGTFRATDRNVTGNLNRRRGTLTVRGQFRFDPGAVNSTSPHKVFVSVRLRFHSNRYGYCDSRTRRLEAEAR
jgi:hypothetical protein